MKTKEILKLTPGEMRERMVEMEQQYFELKMKKSIGQLKSPSVMRGLRKDLARIRCKLAQDAKQIS